MTEVFLDIDVCSCLYCMGVMSLVAVALSGSYTLPPDTSSNWWLVERNKDVLEENAETDFGKELKGFFPHQVARSPGSWGWKESRYFCK